MTAELASSLVSTEAQRLEQAEGLVRAYCGWHIAMSRSGRHFVVDEPTRTILLPSLMVTQVDIANSDGTLCESSQYTWRQNGTIICNGWWQVGTVVNYTHGYPTVPPEVVGVVQAIAQRAVDNPGSVVRNQVGPFSVTYSQSGFNQAIPLTLLDAEKAILSRYRLPSRP